MKIVIFKIMFSILIQVILKNINFKPLRMKMILWKLWMILINQILKVKKVSTRYIGITIIITVLRTLKIILIIIVV